WARTEWIPGVIGLRSRGDRGARAWEGRGEGVGGAWRSGGEGVEGGGQGRSRACARTADNGRVSRALRATGRWIWSPRRLMLLLGALLLLAFPVPNLEFLAWFGLVPGLVLIARSPTAREGGMRAWWLGAGYLIAALYWIA